MSYSPTKLTIEPTIILAGATGHLGGLIARELRNKDANVRAIIRPGTEAGKIKALRELGCAVAEADYKNAAALEEACAGGSCVVSALSGLREVIVDAQNALLQAAVSAGVPRFIPSDFSIDFTNLPYGNNRNLDFRKEFGEILEQAPIKATSILNGMFTDLLTGQAPFILFGSKRILYWGNADQLLDFTTIADTAAYTAAAALDSSTPRYLRLAGDVLSAQDLRAVASEVTGEDFKLLRPGGLGLFNFLIKLTKTLTLERGEVFPAWQGMQYMRDMFSGLPKLEPLNNNRYPEIRWTSVREVLTRHLANNQA